MVAQSSGGGVQAVDSEGAEGEAHAELPQVLPHEEASAKEDQNQINDLQ